MERDHLEKERILVQINTNTSSLVPAPPVKSVQKISTPEKSTESNEETVIQDRNGWVSGVG
jgi:hypothetical protein